MKRVRPGLYIGLVLFVVTLILPIPGLAAAPRKVLATAVLMASWWMSEAAPLAVTSLLPLILFPSFNVVSPKDTAAPYADDLIFLFLGGFFLALALEKWGVHRRIAMRVLRAVGTGPRQVVFGLLAATAFLSMWVSNTATALMMLPIGLAVLHALDPDAKVPGLRPAGLLAIAYGASIGGLGTLIGTPPNLIFAMQAQKLAGKAPDFARWMFALGLPVVLPLAVLAGMWLVFIFRVPARTNERDGAAVAREVGLGPWTGPERIVAVAGVLAAAAWILREPKTLFGVHVVGINTWLPGVSDSTIAIAAALLLFLIPVSGGKRLLEWADAAKVPWGTLLLFGGGLSLAEAFKRTELDLWVGRTLSGGIAGLPVFPTVLILIAVTTVFSEFASNTATAAMLMPLLYSMSEVLKIHPFELMIPATVGASFGFALPVATPPNALIFGTGHVSVREMVKAGLGMDVIAIVTGAVVFYLLRGFLLV